MNISLENFLKLTEGQDITLAAPVSKGITYPFLYVNELSTVELEFWIDKGVLSQMVRTSEDLPLYLKMSSGYKLLGYVSMSYSTLLSLVYLKPRVIKLKESKMHEYDVLKDMLDHYLLL